MIPLLRDAIMSSGGWIMDFHLFSNISICINFELPLRHAGKFHAALSSLSLRLSEESASALEAYRHASEQTGENSAEVALSGTLQVTFIPK